MRVFNGQEMYKDLSRTCTAFVLLIYPFVSWRTRCCRRGGLLKFPYNDVDHDELRPWQTRTHCCRHKCFPICPRAQHLLRTQILCPGHKKCFWFCSETFCVPNKCFPVCAAQETMDNNVSAAMCPRLPGPLAWIALQFAWVALRLACLRLAFNNNTIYSQLPL